MDRSTLPLFPCSNHGAGSLCLLRKKRRDMADLRPNGLCPFQGFGSLLMFFERVKRGLGMTDCYFYFVCARFYVD